MLVAISDVDPHDPDPTENPIEKIPNLLTLFLLFPIKMTYYAMY